MPRAPCSSSNAPRKASSPAAPSWPRISWPPTMIPAPIRSPASTQTTSSSPRAAPQPALGDHREVAVVLDHDRRAERARQRAGEVEVVGEDAAEQHAPARACPSRRCSRRTRRAAARADAGVLERRRDHAPDRPAAAPSPANSRTRSADDVAAQVGDGRAHLDLADVDAGDVARRRRGTPASAPGRPRARLGGRAPRSTQPSRTRSSATASTVGRESPVRATSSVTRSGPPSRSASSTRCGVHAAQEARGGGHASASSIS